MVIESFLLNDRCGDFILTELNHFFYTLGLTSIVTLHFRKLRLGRTSFSVFQGENLNSLIDTAR